MFRRRMTSRPATLFCGVGIMVIMVGGIAAASDLCDNSLCLGLTGCQVMVYSSDDGSSTRPATLEDDPSTSLMPCVNQSGEDEEGYTGYPIIEQTFTELSSAESDTVMYTCCLSGYEGIPTSVLQEECSVAACNSPDGRGGTDCSADGFIHPLTCTADPIDVVVANEDGDETTIQKAFPHPRKGDVGNIYKPYVCCTEPPSEGRARGLVTASSIWTLLSGLATIMGLLLVGGILRSRSCRAQGFNWYIVWLAVPDILFNFFSLLRNCYTLSHANQLSSQLGALVHGLEWFHTSANFSLNAVVIHQVFSLIRNSRRCRRVQPPTVRQVCLHQALPVFLWSLLWAAWSLVLLFYSKTMFPRHSNVAWLLSKALMVGPPFLYSMAAGGILWYNQWLPKRGRTRVLGLYFGRVVLVFWLTWVPFLVLVDVTYYRTAKLWMLGLAYYFSSLQGIASAVVALTKPDIRRAVLNLACCRSSDNFGETELKYLGANGKTLGKSQRFSLAAKKKKRGNNSNDNENGTNDADPTTLPVAMSRTPTMALSGMQSSTQQFSSVNPISSAHEEDDDGLEPVAADNNAPESVNSDSIRIATAATGEWEANDEWDDGHDSERRSNTSPMTSTTFEDNTTTTGLNRSEEDDINNDNGGVEQL